MGCVCVVDANRMLLQTSTFVLASPLWKQARSYWNFKTMRISIGGRLLFCPKFKNYSPSKRNRSESAT